MACLAPPTPMAPFPILIKLNLHNISVQCPCPLFVTNVSVLECPKFQFLVSFSIHNLKLYQQGFLERLDIIVLPKLSYIIVSLTVSAPLFPGPRPVVFSSLKELRVGMLDTEISGSLVKRVYYERNRGRELGERGRESKMISIASSKGFLRSTMSRLSRVPTITVGKFCIEPD